MSGAMVREDSSPLVKRPRNYLYRLMFSVNIRVFYNDVAEETPIIVVVPETVNRRGCRVCR